MTLIYMKPAVEAECGICGDYVRRAQPWPYSESGGPDSVALMQPAEGKGCFSLIDEHTLYMKDGTYNKFQLYVTSVEPRLFDDEADLVFVHNGVINDPLIDMIINPDHYDVWLDGVQMTDLINNPGSYAEWWDYSSGAALRLNESGDVLGSNRVHFKNFAPFDEHTGNMKIYRLGVLVSEVSCYFHTTNPVYTQLCDEMTMTQTTGNFFTGIAYDPTGIMEIIN